MRRLSTPLRSRNKDWLRAGFRPLDAPDYRFAVGWASSRSYGPGSPTASIPPGSRLYLAPMIPTRYTPRALRSPVLTDVTGAKVVRFLVIFMLSHSRHRFARGSMPVPF
jgi:hypothetical protein